MTSRHLGVAQSLFAPEECVLQVEFVESLVFFYEALRSFVYVVPPSLWLWSLFAHLFTSIIDLFVRIAGACRLGIERSAKKVAGCTGAESQIRLAAKPSTEWSISLSKIARVARDKSKAICNVIEYIK